MISIQQVNSSNTNLVAQIADLYFDQWAIPKDRTITRLANHPNDDVLFQLVHTNNDHVITTGGLYNHVGLLNEHPGFSCYNPWVAQIVTEKNYRGKGYGAELLKEIEKLSAKAGFNKIYLFTFTAENLYIRNGWLPLERTIYKGHDTVIMYKSLAD